MDIIEQVNEWKTIRQKFQNKATVGFVPTMGCLHQGHAALIRKAVQENEISVVTIFVNPRQFNNEEDYIRYPRTLNEDINLLRTLGIHYVLIPSAEQLYPEENNISLLCEHPIANIMEGKVRPGHFNGMLTIVNKLLLLVKADTVYFGEKDYQQFLLVKMLIKAHFFDTKLILCPTVRDEFGLPYSSRNQRLTPEQWQLARKFSEIFYQPDKNDLTFIANALKQQGIQLEYLERYEDRIFIAVKIGDIRLIDNRKMN